MLHDYIDASTKPAAKDPRITGLVVRIAPLQTGWGKLEEIRAHLLKFRKSGKPSICYLGYDGIGNPEYYLASACQQIWLVPTAPVSIRGMMAEALFFRGTLDKLKIVPEFYHIAEYQDRRQHFHRKKIHARAQRGSRRHCCTASTSNISTDASEGAATWIARQFEALAQSRPVFNPTKRCRAKLSTASGYWDQVQELLQGCASAGGIPFR